MEHLCESTRGALGYAGMVGTTTAALVVALVILFRRGGAYPLPPGPRGIFLAGGLGRLSGGNSADEYIRWGEEYSEFA